MSLKSRLQKVEENMTRMNHGIKDPHGKRSPFRVKAIELWERGDFVKLKEHCKDDLEFYNQLVSYTKVIEELVAKENKREIN
ncbi:hypothetical protein ACQKGA_28295 [Priestia megaterium]|uniref:hypothetical protein n=1 Tax=Priestia megaterium TaxID=1404 RepID=UPI003D024D60